MNRFSSDWLFGMPLIFRQIIYLSENSCTSCTCILYMHMKASEGNEVFRTNPKLCTIFCIHYRGSSPSSAEIGPLSPSVRSPISKVRGNEARSATDQRYRSRPRRPTYIFSPQEDDARWRATCVGRSRTSKLANKAK